MWTRADIKEKARAVLSVAYWKCFLVSIIIVIASGGSGGGSGGGSSNGSGSSMPAEQAIIIISIVTVIIILAILFRLFVGYALEVGGRKFYIRAAEEEVNVGYLGYIFDKTKYFDVLKSMLLQNIFLFLWFLLLVIPGIVKSYAYRYVPYILADNPNIGAKRAIELSNKMTDGEKWNIFVLDWSFIGWYLLGMLALFIGVIFVTPYAHATDAELYLILRKKAIESHETSYEELNLSQPIDFY